MPSSHAMEPRTPERLEELAEQRRKSDIESARWKAIFDGVDERVIAPSMTAFADELGRAGRWVDEAPATEVRLSGSGIRNGGKFTVPGSVEGETRKVRINLEVFPTTGERFIVHLEVGDKTERKTFDVAGFESEEGREAADAGLKTWLEAQFDKLVRRRVRF